MKQPKITNFFMPILNDKQAKIKQNFRFKNNKIKKIKSKPKPKPKPRRFNKKKIENLIDEGYLGDSEDENYSNNIKVLDLVYELKYLKVSSI